MTPANVSRETSEALEFFTEELLRWTKRINLIGRSTTSEVVLRHIEDSRQVSDAGPPDPERWIDLGSGGGLPVLVAAILRREGQTQFVAIESDQRKATFLRHVAVHLNLRLEVIADRIERAIPQHGDVVSARALAPLDKLLTYAQRHGKPGCICLFPKGETFQQELESARLNFRFDAAELPSATSAGSVVLKIKDIRDA